MKHKFGEFERQSEDYYSSLLEKFKIRASNEIQRKEHQLLMLENEKKGHMERLAIIRERLIERRPALRGVKEILSDDELSDDPEEEVPYQETYGDKVGNAMNKKVLSHMEHDVLLSEGKLAKINKERLREEIRIWCEQFEKDNGRKPEDADVGPIAGEVEEWNENSAKYVEMKYSCYKFEGYPSFDADKFMKE